LEVIHGTADVLPPLNDQVPLALAPLI
jgi:hypothetical protein